MKYLVCKERIFDPQVYNDYICSKIIFKMLHEYICYINDESTSNIIVKRNLCQKKVLLKFHLNHKFIFKHKCFLMS